MSYIFQINPFRKDPEKEQVCKRLSTANQEELVSEVSKAILCQSQAQIDLIRENIPLSSLSKMTPPISYNNVEDEAFILPLPREEKTFSPLAWLPTPSFFGKTAQYITATISQSYLIDLDTPPKSTWSAQSQLNTFRLIVNDSKWIFESTLIYFVSLKKTILAAAGVLACLLGIKSIYYYFRLGVPETLDKQQITNLTSKAEAGDLRKAIGRTEETQCLITALTASSIEKQKIAFLVGKPGVGKTQLVESLATEINEGSAPSLKGKNIFSVNTASLTEPGNYSDQGYSSRLDLIFKEIENYEKDVILFFDEAHNAAGKEGAKGRGNGLLIELLKTKLLEKNISAILATTEEEYEEHIAPNKAFVERTEHISISPLSDEQTKLILKESVQNKQIKISLDAIDAILEIGNNNGNFKSRANPRKAFDILQKAERYVKAWQPSSLKKEHEKAEIELRTFKANHSKENDLLSQIKEKVKQLDHLKLAIQTQKASLDAIRQIGSIEALCFQKYCQTVHLLNNSAVKGETLQRDYLFFKEILLPTIQKIFSQKVEKFQSEYKETIPLQIDTPLLEKLYPS